MLSEAVLVLVIEVAGCHANLTNTPCGGKFPWLYLLRPHRAADAGRELCRPPS